MESSTSDKAILESLFLKVVTVLAFILNLMAIVFVYSSQVADPIPQTLIIFGYGIALSSLFLLLINPPVNVWLKLPNQSYYPYSLILGSIIFYGSIFVILGLFSGTLQPSQIFFIDSGFYFYTYCWIVISINLYISWFVFEQVIPSYLSTLDEHE